MRYALHEILVRGSLSVPFIILSILHLASMSLLKHQPKILRQNFAQNKKHYDNTMAELKDLLDDNHLSQIDGA